MQIERISHNLLAEALKDSGRVAAYIRSVLEDYDGPVTPIVNRVAIQLLDSIFRSPDFKVADFTPIGDCMAWMEQRFGKIPAVILFSGAQVMLRGDRKAAFEAYHEAAEAIGETGLPRIYVGAYSIRRDGNSDWVGDEPKRPISSAASVTWRKDPQRKSTICAYMAGDQKYFLKFARLIYESFRAVDSTSQIHFHVVNWSVACVDAFAGVNDDMLSFSSEEYRYERDYSYFAVVRFFRALEILEKLQVPLYVTDLDNKFISSMENIVAELSEFDAAFNSRAIQKMFPWWGPTAWNTYLNCNENGKRIAHLMRNYTGARFTIYNVAKTWWFDQLMLNEVETQAKAEGLKLGSTTSRRFTITDPRRDAETAEMKKKG